MVPKIKICGIKRDEEISVLNDLKVDYVGFVFAKSKRQVSLEQAITLKNKLNPEIQSVAVVQETDKDLLNAILEANFHVLQWHGPIDNSLANNLEPLLWLAIGIEDEHSIESLRTSHPNVAGYVLDNRNPGSGHVFDWSLINRKDFKSTLILAGGLNSNNIQEAIHTVAPDVVDVSSGVENEMGKDPVLIEEFIRKVRETYGK
jgi:phosphoribosylanthranilate isomerase